MYRIICFTVNSIICIYTVSNMSVISSHQPAPCWSLWRLSVKGRLTDNPMYNTCIGFHAVFFFVYVCVIFFDKCPHNVQTIIVFFWAKWCAEMLIQSECKVIPSLPQILHHWSSIRCAAKCVKSDLHISIHAVSYHRMALTWLQFC